MESKYIYLIIGAIVIVAVIVTLYFTLGKKSKEGFLLTTQPAKMSSAGAIVGQGIMTDQMIHKAPAEITKQINSNGYVNDGDISIGVTVGPGFDTAYQNQLEIQSIDDKAEGGYQQREDLTEISKKIGSNTNNAAFNLYSRGGTAPTKLLLAPTETRCVIDEEFLPERDKNRQIASVGTVIPMQGYDINVERLDQEVRGVHFAQFTPNKNTKGKRTPTASGATPVTESANASAVAEEIKTNGDVVSIKNGADGADVVAKLDNSPETFTKYAKY